MSSGVTESEARAMALQGVVEISRGIDFAVAEIRAGRFMVAAETLLLAKAGCVVTEAAIQKIRYRESTPAAMTCDAAAELLRGYAPAGVSEEPADHAVGDVALALHVAEEAKQNASDFGGDGGSGGGQGGDAASWGDAWTIEKTRLIGQ